MEKFIFVKAYVLASLKMWYKFSADQPRVPAGDPRGGEWVSQEGIGGRAAGGVFTVGINGRTYLGGQFLPESTEAAAEKEQTRLNKVAKEYINRKQEVAPYVWELPPTETSIPITRQLTGRVVWDFDNRKYDWEATSQAIRDSSLPSNAEELVRRFNSGERWMEMTQEQFDNIYKPKKKK